MEKSKKPKFPSELRFDIISKDWVIIATGRAKRPEAFKSKKENEIYISERDCPFCNIRNQEPPVLIFTRLKVLHNINQINQIPENWTTIVIPNKYPALLPAKKMTIQKEGNLYRKLNGIGFCELVITRDHKKHFAEFEIWQIKEVFDAYQKRFLSLMKKSFVKYISIFHNHGATAGASQSHPHSQIITTPLIDIDLQRALLNSKKYFQKTKKCIYCEMNKWEIKVKKRIVFENDLFLAVCPFASKSAFEVIISPKIHSSNFEKIKENEKWKLAEIFSAVMKKIYKGLGNIDYNFYLHTAPCDGQKYHYYHWHWTILPKTSIMAGFEFGTKIEISTIEPEMAAEYLSKQ